jgi:hypothetical protein
VIAIISALLTIQPITTVQQPPPPRPPERPGRGGGGLPTAATAEKPPPKYRVLLCAQSNAAIDELIMRLAEPGVVDALGRNRQVISGPFDFISFHFRSLGDFSWP